MGTHPVAEDTAWPRRTALTSANKQAQGSYDLSLGLSALPILIFSCLNLFAQYGSDIPNFTWFWKY